MLAAVRFISVLALIVTAMSVRATSTLAAPARQGTTEPAPLASGCSAGNRVSAAGQQLYQSIPGADGQVALTFDMNGPLAPQAGMIEYLVDAGVCATIFAAGERSQTAEGRAVLELIAANPGQLEVGNHTMHHCDLADGTTGDADCPTGPASAQFVMDELWQAAAVIENISGLSPAPYWRPPYAEYTSFIIDAAADAGYTKTFMWTIDTRDWEAVADGGPTTAEMVNQVVSGATSGSIVLFHTGGYNTAEAIPQIIAGLRERGFVLTSLSDMLTPAVAGTPFTDISDSQFISDISWAYDNDITAGCTSDRFCPEATVTRDQMASFLVRMFNLPSTTQDFFTDDGGNQHEGSINRLAAAGITAGCTTTSFCPRHPVTRDQMASFIARAADLSIGAGRNYFNDDDGNQHESNIDRLAAAGITGGCAEWRYCPTGTVTRGQMTAFLHRIVDPVSPPPYPAE